MEDAERLLESAVREADRAMYEAKAAGRNQVAVGREIAPSEPV
jgi:PleD family two-component response regulator